MVQFDLFNTPRGFAISSLLVVCSPPPGMRKEKLLHSRAPDRPHTFFWVQFLEKNIDFRAIAK